MIPGTGLGAYAQICRDHQRFITSRRCATERIRSGYAAEGPAATCSRDELDRLVCWSQRKRDLAEQRRCHSAVAGPCFPGVGGCSPAVPATNIGTILATGSTFNTGLGNGAGFIGGGQFGYNWQFNGRGVAGFEADIAWTSQNRNVVFANSIAPFPGVVDAYNATISSHLDYLGTVRGRLGFLATPAFLLYGTGGLAYGGVRSSTVETALISPPAACAGGSCFGSGGGSFADTRVGWTAGAGGEWMFAPNWSVKLEYLYYDLGGASYPTTLNQVCNGPGCFFNGVVFGSTTGTTSLRYTGSIARVGVNWHFNGPILAKN